MPFYIRDLSIHGFWYGGGGAARNQFPTDYQGIIICEIKNLRFLWFGGFFLVKLSNNFFIMMQKLTDLSFF